MRPGLYRHHLIGFVGIVVGHFYKPRRLTITFNGILSLKARLRTPGSLRFSRSPILIGLSPVKAIVRNRSSSGAVQGAALF
jgi:hypothetical protein